MTNRKDMTAKQIAQSVWEEMKTRHEQEITDMKHNHTKDYNRLIARLVQEREMVKRELGDLLK